MAVERYERKQLLEKGSMSHVWLARDTYAQRSVVLKIMTVIAEDDRRSYKAQQRFHREIEIARSLQHIHVLPVLNYGYMDYEENYVPFLVSPYMPDGSLADLIKAQPPWKSWSWQQTADVLMQAASGLWHLHTRHPPIVHGDVKPGNFLIRWERSPQRIAHLYLCDFGISRWLHSSSPLASELLGTFVYIAPEQVERQVHCASDQYALAVMACYLLTGKLPIQAATNEEYAQAHLHVMPKAPSQLNPERGISPWIDEVILRALEKDPAQRFPTIMLFAQTLQQAIEQLIREQAAAKTERLKSGFAPTFDREYSKPFVQPVYNEAALSIVLDPFATSDEHVLDEPLPARPQKVARMVTQGEVAYNSLALKNIGRWELPARPRLLSWSPDGNYVACALYGHAPLVVGRDGKVQTVQFAQAAEIASLCWSPDSRVLAVSAQGTIHFWDCSAQSALPPVIYCNVRSIDALDWSVDARLAVWAENQIVLYPLPFAALTTRQIASMQTIATGTMRSGNVGVLRWSPDGTLLVAGASNGALVGWHGEKLALTWNLMEPGQKVNSIAWSPDGVLLVAALRDARMVAWDMRTKSNVCTWTKLPAMPRTISVSRAGRITVASTERRLLSGFPGENFPSTTCPGQLLVAWSPLRSELATLEENREISLVLWRE